MIFVEILENKIEATHNKYCLDIDYQFIYCNYNICRDDCQRDNFKLAVSKFRKHSSVYHDEMFVSYV